MTLRRGNDKHCQITKDDSEKEVIDRYLDMVDGVVFPGGFKIRLKITDDMKGYDTYTLYYLDDDYQIRDTVVLTKNGDYFEGILPHLSGYVLVGSMNTSNPNTGDNIVLYITLLGLSVCGLVGVGIYTRRKKFN